jgi:hypothetical protein
MKVEPSPTVVGSFVLGALALASAALLFFGVRNPFVAPKRLVVFLQESAAGLSRGAAVKFLGVPSGRVVAIIPTLGPQPGSSIVAVVCDVSSGRLEGPGGRPIDLSDPPTVRTLVAEGLRARLMLASFSGEYTMNLDFYDPRRYPAKMAPEWAAATQPFPEVPAIPSVTGELLDNLEGALRGLRSADIESLVRNLQAADFKGTLQKIGAMADSIKQLADFLERNPNAIISGKKAAKP